MRVFTLEAVRKRRWFHFLLLTVLPVVGASVLRGAGFPGTELLDTRLYDLYCTTRYTVSPDALRPLASDIILVKTSHAIPRPQLAELLKRFSQAKVVAFDLMFVNPGDDLTEEEKGNSYYKDAIEDVRVKTQPLIREVRRNGKVVICAWPESDENERGVVASLSGSSRIDPNKIGATKTGLVWQRPGDDLWRAAGYHGHVNVWSDITDQVVRTVPLFENVDGSTPCMGLALACAVLKVPPSEVAKLRVENGALTFQGRRYPVDPHGCMLINYIGPKQTFSESVQVVDYAVALDEKPSEFKDKIIIVGEVSRKSKEYFNTPYGIMPGMQIHANVLTTFLNPAGPLRPAPPIVTWVLALCCNIVVVAPLFRRTLWASLVTTVLATLAVVVIGIAIFMTANMVLPASIPLVSIALALSFASLYAYLRVRATLENFVGGDLASRNLGAFTHLKLGGTEQEATAFFCDLRGYTGLSEVMNQEALTKLVLDYTDSLVNVVQKWEGRAIDFLGDGVFVLFEKGKSGRDHARNAVDAALELRDELTKLTRKWHEEGAPSLEFGIGIVTGTMTIGIVGSRKSMKMGALGAPVNLASRIQGLSRECGYQILIDEETRARLSDNHKTESCGEKMVKGRTDPVEVFGVVA